jgi:hypothetical protein
MQVKSELARRENDLEILGDAIHTEKVKMQRLKKILGQYS